MTTRVLTGITPSGTPHLGNYAGAIRPSIQASQQPDVDAFFFLADYHALIKCDDPARVARSRLEIAATWLAAGLDPQKVTFYRQSDIPEIPQLCWILTCVTAKGLMNRAHAYKAAVDANQEKNEDPDDGITMGLFSYPVLMAADILMFNANQVPVGRDQIQHIEMARDIAQRFNHLYGKKENFFTLPNVLIDDKVATLPGLDGRKMSKSYDNTIPLFEGGEKALEAAIRRIVTDSRQPGESKEADGSHLFTIYQAFASPEQANELRTSLAQGMAWGEAKQQLFQLLENELEPLRERYKVLMNNPEQIEDILQHGADKARRYAQPFIERIREAVGLGLTTSSRSTEKIKKAKDKKTLARLVSFRDNENQFRFRLFNTAGQELFLSTGFSNPKEAGKYQNLLKNSWQDGWLSHEGDIAVLVIEQQEIARFPANLIQDVQHSLQELNS